MTTNPAGDRNVLFGVMAWQLGIVEREPVMEALFTWTTDRSRSLADLLEQRGMLSSADRKLLENVVERQIERHAGDAAKTLAGLGGVEQLRNELTQAVAPATAPAQQPAESAALEAPTIARSPTIDAGPAPARPASAASLSTNDRRPPDSGSERFRIVRPHARGGLGEVLVAHDEELHREVALKQILPRHAQNETSRTRFLREAEVTGNLEHPGVVPVYGLGVQADGRPYYAMRFIRGESLDDALRRYHDDAREHRSESDRAVEFRGLLTRFIAVCNTIEYAHSRGFVHRDLKPENIMLGPYGETLVVDWGLARPINSGVTLDDEVASADGSDVSPASQTVATPTQMGTVVGTPQFMSPEQATGRIDLIGPAGDVYSLGATLYTLLTDQPPFTSMDVRTVLKAVPEGKFPTPREVNRDVPAALEAVCLKAMSRRIEDRYASARALADDLEHWLADEPVSAARETWPERAMRWVRRHKTWSQAAAAAVVVVAIVAGVAYVREAGLHAVLQRTLEQEQSARREADEARRTADQEKRTAEAHARRADAQSALALKTLESVLYDIQVRLRNVPAAHAARSSMLQRVIEGLKQVARNLETAAGTDHSLVRAHLDLGDVFLQAGTIDATSATEEAQRQFERAAELAERRRAESADDDRSKHDLAAAYRRLGDVGMQRGNPTSAAEWFRMSLALYDGLAAAAADDAALRRELAEVVQRSGLAAQQLGDLAATKTAYTRFFDLAARLAGGEKPSLADRRTLSVSHERLGDLSLLQDDVPAAEKHFRESLAVRKAIAAEEPDNAEARRDLSVTLDRLGDLAFKRGDDAGAAQSYAESLQLRTRLAESDPNNVQAQRDLLVSYVQLGDVEMRRNDLAAAESSYERYHAIAVKLSAADPANMQLQRDLATSFDRLGFVFASTRRTAQAREAYRRNFEIVRRAAEADPSNAQTRSDLSSAAATLADLSRQAGDSAEARSCLSEYVRHARRWATGASDAAPRRTLVDALVRAADTEVQLGAWTAAATLLAEARDVVGGMHGGESDVATAATAAMVYGISGQLEIERRDPRAAREHLLRAVERLEIAARSERDDARRVYHDQIAEQRKLIASCEAASQAAASAEATPAQDPALRRELLDFRAAAQIRSGDAAGALETIERFVAASTDGETLFSAARRTARAAAADLPNDVRERAARLAVERLEKAEKAGWFADRLQAARLEYAEDFESVRRRDDFRKLLERVNGVGPKKNADGAEAATSAAPRP